MEKEKPLTASRPPACRCSVSEDGVDPTPSGTLSGMTPTRRRLMLGLGAALLVGGWWATSDSMLDHFVHPLRGGYSYIDRSAKYVYFGGVAGMVVGAGLIGFAVLRPTNRKDE